MIINIIGKSPVNKKEMGHIAIVSHAILIGLNNKYAETPVSAMQFANTAYGIVFEIDVHHLPTAIHDICIAIKFYDEVRPLVLNIMPTSMQELPMIQQLVQIPRAAVANYSMWKIREQADSDTDKNEPNRPSPRKLIEDIKNDLNILEEITGIPGRIHSFDEEVRLQLTEGSEELSDKSNALIEMLETAHDNIMDYCMSVGVNFDVAPTFIGSGINTTTYMFKVHCCAIQEDFPSFMLDLVKSLPNNILAELLTSLSVVPHENTGIVMTFEVRKTDIDTLIDVCSTLAKHSKHDPEVDITYVTEVEWVEKTNGKSSEPKRVVYHELPITGNPDLI